MTKNIRITWAIIFLAAMVSPAGFAQTTGGPGRRTPRYDPSTEITVKGTVEDVIQQTGRRGMPGTHLTVKTDNEVLNVLLGPASFLAAQKFEFAKGDQIELTGSKIKIAGADAIVAREVKRGDKTLTLRNAQGIPQWSRGRRRSKM